MIGFALGWDPQRAAASRAEVLASRRYCTVAPGQTYPKAISLSQYLLREMRQLQAGTCWVHAGVCLAETLAVGQGYEAFPISRWLVGWKGKQFEGGGNAADGGAVTDALLAMTQEKGAGIAHEDLWPYPVTPQMGEGEAHRVLAPKPPTAAWEDAKKSHLLLPVDVRSDDDAKVMIAQRYPVSIGTWWPFNFDEGRTFMASIGRGMYGHALTKIGYAEAGVFPGEEGKSAWWQWRNWHGLLYPPLPASHAAVIPGYKSDTPEKTSDFWVPQALDKRLQGMGNYEYVSATDITGLDRKIVLPASIYDSFVI